MAKQELVKKVEEMLEGFLPDKGLEIYNLEYKKEGPNWVLRIYLDKSEDPDDFVGIDECEAVAQFLSEKLDEEDIIDRAYNLEVSSPGLDRELIKPKDFERFAGREVELKFYEPFECNKEANGSLVGLNDNIVIVNIDDQEKHIPIEKISKINLAVIF